MSLLLALLLSATAPAEKLFVVQVATERANAAGVTRRTLGAVALPVGPDGLLMAVGFSLSAPVEEDDAVSISAVHPDGRVVKARLLGGDEDLRSTFFRLTGDTFPEPVALETVELEPGDPVVLHSRYGERLDHAPRSREASVEAVARYPQRLYALRGEVDGWTGAIATTPDGRLVGFVDERPAMLEGAGAMVGLGASTTVIVPADAYAVAAREPPEPEGAPASRAWLGVNLVPFDEPREAFFGVQDENGALVTGVAEGSPADVAGVEVFDLIRRIGPLEMTFETMEDWPILLRQVGRLPTGQGLAMAVTRFRKTEEGAYRPEELELSITLGARPLDFEDAPETELPDLGMKVKPLTEDIRRTLRLPAGTGGVVVTSADRGSAAQLAGLRPGDLLLGLDRSPIESVDHLRTLLAAAKEERREKIVFFVRRGANTTFLPVEPGW